MRYPAFLTKLINWLGLPLQNEFIFPGANEKWGCFALILQAILLYFFSFIWFGIWLSITRGVIDIIPIILGTMLILAFAFYRIDLNNFCVPENDNQSRYLFSGIPKRTIFSSVSLVPFFLITVILQTVQIDVNPMIPAMLLLFYIQITSIPFLLLLSSWLILYWEGPGIDSQGTPLICLFSLIFLIWGILSLVFLPFFYYYIWQ